MTARPDRIAGGPSPLDEALPIARQIAEALEAAHEQASAPRMLFEHSGYAAGSHQYDVAPGGHRFPMVKLPAEAAVAPQLIVVKNWFEELKRLVPTN